MATNEHSALNLCILENGIVPEDLQEKYTSYPKMIEQWLAPHLPEARFTYISAVNGQLLPQANAFDGYILSGSKHSTYENTEWIRNLIQLLRQARDEHIPLFGICFGHQLMADAFGGCTRKALQGWGVGAQHYDNTPEAPSSGASFIFHQDQVDEMPEQARCIGGSTHCRHGVLAYEFPALSVQYHPEFTTDYIRTLAQKFSGNLLPEDIAEDALSSLDTLEVDNARVADWVAGFFRRHKPA